MDLQERGLRRDSK